MRAPIQSYGKIENLSGLVTTLGTLGVVCHQLGRSDFSCDLEKTLQDLDFLPGCLLHEGTCICSKTESFPVLCVCVYAYMLMCMQMHSVCCCMSVCIHICEQVNKKSASAATPQTLVYLTVYYFILYLGKVPH